MLTAEWDFAGGFNRLDGRSADVMRWIILCILEAVQCSFSILLRIGIIRSTYAHVPIAKVVGAATRSPHSPPMGHTPLAWAVKDLWSRLNEFDEGYLAHVLPTCYVLGDSSSRQASSQPVVEAMEDDLPWLFDVEPPRPSDILSPMHSVESVGTTGRGGTVAVAELQRMYNQHSNWWMDFESLRVAVALCMLYF